MKGIFFSGRGFTKTCIFRKTENEDIVPVFWGKTERRQIFFNDQYFALVIPTVYRKTLEDADPEAISKFFGTDASFPMAGKIF